MGWYCAGIVHRDLKSLNLLLDNKWNVKVSDFGLTKFRDELKKGGQAGQMQGSVHWMAPEILNETLDADYILADVYAFGSLALTARIAHSICQQPHTSSPPTGIILWELFTREQPYLGLRCGLLLAGMPNGT